MNQTVRISPQKQAELDARMLSSTRRMNRVIERMPEVLDPEELADWNQKQKIGRAHV